MQTVEGQTSGVELRFIICAVYLLLGMALIAMCFNLMQVNKIYFFIYLNRKLNSNNIGELIRRK